MEKSNPQLDMIQAMLEVCIEQNIIILSYLDKHYEGSRESVRNRIIEALTQISKGEAGILDV